jgi:hypothetical protein
MKKVASHLVSSPVYLRDADYKLAISLLPVVAVDLIVRDEGGRVLMGLRNIHPWPDAGSY